MGALDCVNRISTTESTEVFAGNMASNTTLNESRKDLEAQSPNSDQCTKPRGLRWTLGFDVPLLLIVAALVVLFEFGVIPSNKGGFYCNDPALSFPDIGETVTASILLSTLCLLPLGIILSTELIFPSSDVESKSGTLSGIRRTLSVYRTYLFGLAMNLCIVEVMKGIAGSPRPIFFELCKPDTGLTCNGSEYVSTYRCISSYSWWYQMDSYRSFPSGHTSMSVYSGFFMAWYLQCRAFDWSHRSVILVPVLQLLSVSYSVVCSLTRVTDRRHHWWDVAAGAAVGFLTLFYAVIFLGNNFCETPKQISDTKSEQNQKTAKILLFEERRSL